MNEKTDKSIDKSRLQLVIRLIGGEENKKKHHS